ncbi:MAG: toll/interleukin-1 receptor domain-containing protein [Pseudomonadota bacterium]
MPKSIFLSHSTKDADIAHGLCRSLEDEGYLCWIAPRDISPGEEWGKAIIDGIAASDVFVLIFSRHANASPQVLREVERAVNGGKPIIPFRIENAEPEGSIEYFMSVPHWLDAFPAPVDDHIPRLLAALGGLTEGKVTASPSRVRQKPSTVATPVASGLGRFGPALGMTMMVALAVVAGLGPPLQAIAWSSIVAALSIATGILLTQLTEPWRVIALRVPLIGTTLGAMAVYLWSSSNFVREGYAGEMVITGMECTDDGLLVYGEACPDLPATALIDAGFMPELLWTSASISRAGQLIGGSWLVMVLCASILVASFFAVRAVGPKGER